LRIESGDIESQLLTRDDVAQCAVLLRKQAGIPDWLALYIVPGENCSPDRDDIRRFLQSRLPRGMVPADICIIEKFPLTPNGKVDFMALPVNDPAIRQGEDYVAPRGLTEETLARIWSDELGLSGDEQQVGAHDNFFALRGHSLLATRVIARIGEELGLEVPLQCIFETPTVAGLARSIDALRWAVQSADHVDSGDAGREVFRL
jgi:acyl carrier protein